MSYQGSNAGRDEARSVSHRSVGDDRISTTSVRVRTRNTGPPISFNNKYGKDERLPRSQSRSRDGSKRAPSVASERTARPPSHRSGSISRGALQRKTGSHYGSQHTLSVASDRTARPPIPRARGRDTDSQAIDTQSYTSGQLESKIMVPEEGRGSLYEEEWKAGRSVYLREKPSGRIASSEASDRTLKSAREMASLSEDTESLSLDPRDPPDVRVAKWNEKVKRDTLKIGPRSVNSIDHYGEGSNAPSHQEYQESLHSERPSHTSKQSRDLALRSYRDPDAPSRTSYSRQSDASSDAPARTSRNSPPPPHRGTYIKRADYSQMYVTHETHETHIHAPDLSFMNEPSKSEKKRIRAHELELERISLKQSNS
ncbi:hypothetical protein BOTNAR_0843g00030 [Botryotinia narcissicola]|uniref:Uncharacterized protein n=1 Tax=Botryotinia narcissicola TaxID=278944 RepID=A0A4Z1H5A1_9HELO|nr:hypothetical protein BOTNAR_0843g00030 [Botryotinia narcissicola]